MISCLLAAAVGLVPTGCSWVRPPPESVVWHDPQEPQLGASSSDAVRGRYDAHPGKPFHVLVLSGGAAWGAWGAGVLKGWRDNAAAPRPEFDVVTGVSVGAVLATHAFLGEPADDEILAKSATETTTPQVIALKPVALLPYAMLLPNFLFNSASWPNALFNTNSAVSSEPLRGQIAKLLPDDTLRRVAEAGRGGRRLLVATVRLDTGLTHIWDLTELAAGDDPGRFERYRTILLACMSVPAAMPPVEIDGAFHVDAGARCNMLFECGMIPVSADRPARPATVHVILNHRLSVAHEPHAERSNLAMLTRTVQILFSGSVLANLYRIRALAAEVGAEMRMCPIPEDFRRMNPKPMDFCRADMRALYEHGVEWARRNGWNDKLFPRGRTGAVRSR